MSRTGLWLFAALLSLPAAGGCSLGPRALEISHGQYNQAIKLVEEEQFLLNLVRARYNDGAMRLDVSSIAAQYELGAAVEAQPFFNSQAARVSNPSIYKTFTSILPFARVSGVDRPTISLTPLDDAETIRSLYTPSTLDGMIFLAESSYPVAAVFRLFAESMNDLPNGITASGPARRLVPRFREFRHAADLLQGLADRGDIRFAREEQFREIGSPLPAAEITAEALVEAARNGYVYRQRPDSTWTLMRREPKLVLRIASAAANTTEVAELVQALSLKPGLLEYEILLGGASTPDGKDQGGSIRIYPRSPVQAFHYLANSVNVPAEHLDCGLIQPTLEPDGTAFDWQEVTEGLLVIHHAKQHGRPDCAYVAVKYRDYWFYIDDRDAASKITLSLAMTLGRVNLLGVRKGSPILTLPVGR